MLKDVDDVLETMRIGEEPPIDVEIQHIEIFFEFGSATDSKDFEALHNTVLGVDDQSLCSDVRTEIEQMYDELRRSFEMFQRIVNKLTLYVKRKKLMHSWQMTICMTCSNNKV